MVTPTEELREVSPHAVSRQGRLRGPDGLRGLAALFVVLHHCWLSAFPGFPHDNGPAWASWMMYGHLAVVVFIVLSGFSLGVGPARADWQLGGVRRFLRRRAWRILPPYWAALVFSLVVAWTLMPQPAEGVPTGKSVLVFGTLLQDTFGSPSPNGAFWSIAVEAHLYLVFPLLLLFIRRIGAWLTLGAVTACVVAVQLASGSVHVVAELLRFTPQFAALFTAGLIAAGAVRVGAHRAGRGIPWGWLSLAAGVPVIVLIVVAGPEWVVGHFFWVDLLAGPCVALLLAALAQGRPAPLVRVLDTRPLRRLGSFSYSLYLIHAPIVVVVYHYVVAPRIGVGAFLLTLVVCVPVSVAAAALFGSVFEIPFQRYRSVAALRAAVRRPVPSVA